MLIYAKLLKAQQEMAIKKVTIDGYKKPEDENNQDYGEDVEYDKDYDYYRQRKRYFSCCCRKT